MVLILIVHQGKIFTVYPGCTKCVELLIEQGADINTKTLCINGGNLNNLLSTLKLLMLRGDASEFVRPVHLHSQIDVRNCHESIFFLRKKK